jgi:putative transposase
MMFFSNITSSDLITFEGRTVERIDPIQDKKSKEITHYRLRVVSNDGNIELRKFRVEEIPHLLENEILVIDRGYHNRQRQMDRVIYGHNELSGATKPQREKVDLMVFRSSMMERYHTMGMKLTRAGVEDYRPLMEADYRSYQARKNYGTEKPNAAQLHKPLPSSDTLLTNFRKFRKADGNPNAFLIPRPEPIDLDFQASADFCFTIEHLGRDACATRPSKAGVVRQLIKELEQMNRERKAAHHPVLVKVMSQRTYERWIDAYLDPFLTCLQRDGLAKAQKKFGSVEDGRTATVPGEIVQADAWKFHLVTLDTTREKYNRMTEDQRKNVKKVRRWVVVIIDVATRCILGFSICRTPNEQASLEAMRMVFMDKTYLFRAAGIKKSDWNHSCPVYEMVNDCGSEFGKNPFGGALFSQAVRTLSGTLMNTVAGVAVLRGHIERFFWTVDLQWARTLPGYTANNPQSRNDRKPGDEACITDDESQNLFTHFVAKYHATPHRGLNFRTPSAVWDEKIEGVDFDMSQMPSPGQLREACGFYTTATVSEAGIKFAGAVYRNELTRSQRTARQVDRIAEPGGEIEIKIDPFDLGGISEVANGELISVPCADPEMRGKTLRQWQQEKWFNKQKAEAEARSQEGARDEAETLWRDLGASIAREADIGMIGYTQKEIDHIRLQEEFGKGRGDHAYIGRDEYVDPLSGGFETEQDVFDETVDPMKEEVDPDTPTDMDRFRSSAKNHKKKTKKGGKA